ncbi:Hypothetical_protein [Hexamita inflata]|uniref:Hypothetical_protein n=1 Tax=Hexamita inflata TaxID=28002 RepID=A0AA86TEM2_9EUKA|nr:Hypothetical protein HINF_LOCUS4244 [Hexamita inflata]
MQREVGWRLNKDIQPESNVEGKEYKWYPSKGWALQPIKRVIQIDEQGEQIKPDDIPGKVWRKTAKGWQSYKDLSNKDQKPVSKKADKDYIWDDKKKQYKLAYVIQPQTTDRTDLIYQEIQKYNALKAQELAQVQAQPQIQPQPVQPQALLQPQQIQPQAQPQTKPKIIVDNPLLRQYM